MDSFFEAEVEMERKICRDVVCTSHKDEEGKHASATCQPYSSHCHERTLPSYMFRFSSGLVRAASVSVTTSWRFPQQEHEILSKGECT